MAYRHRRLLAAGALASLLAAAGGAHAERHYDCSKPGNATKAACKAAAAAPAAPAPAATAGSTSARHYDCSKPGNASKAACKGAAPGPTTTTAAPAASPAAAPAKPSIFSRILKPKAQPAAPAASTGSPTTAAAAPGGSYVGKSITTTAAGATGQCKDGTYTHATHHSGACSSHGGVAKWMQ